MPRSPQRCSGENGRISAAADADILTAILAGTSAWSVAGFGAASGGTAGTAADPVADPVANAGAASSRAFSTTGTGGSLGRREGVASGMAVGGDGKGWNRFGCRIWGRDDPADAVRAGSGSAKDFFTDISTCSMLGPLS